MKAKLLLLLCMVAGMAAAQNAGINITNPAMALHVFKGSDTALLQLENGSALAPNNSTGLYFKTGNYYTGAVKAIGDGGNIARLGFYTFATGSVTGLRERMSIDDNGNVGINTKSPTNTLDVNGSFRLNNGSQEKGKVLITNNSGVGTWLWGDPVWFSATRNSSPYCPAATGIYALLYNNVEGSSNIGGALNLANNTFTAPIAALYHFDLSLRISPPVSGGYALFEFLKNGVVVRSAQSQIVSTDAFTINFSCDLQLAANDVMAVRLYNGGPTNICIGFGPDSYFSGHVVR